MTEKQITILCWAPRILTFCFALFIGLFATEVFSEKLSFWQTVAAFGMELIPAAIVMAVLAIAWRWEWVGAVLFTAVAVIYCVQVLPKHWNWAATIALPMLLIAGLYLAAWMARRTKISHGAGKMAH